MAIAGAGATPTQADLDVALRICYSMRKLWEDDQAGKQVYVNLLIRMQEWEELTAADGIHEPCQLFLALAALCDTDRLEDAMAPPNVLTVLNETLYRKARHRFKSKAGSEPQRARILAAESVRHFLGITDDSAPQAGEMDTPEPDYTDVAASCSRDVKLTRNSFDYERWAIDALTPSLRAFSFCSALRAALVQRSGGWSQLETDMEKGLECYKDVLFCLRNQRQTLELHDACDFNELHLERIVATMTAQAMLCSESSDRRNLPDVREADTLSQIAVRLRMETYMGNVAAKMKDWQAVALDVTAARARAADIGQFESMLGSHAHGLSKGAFWGLWYAAKHDGYNGEKVRAFLEKANEEFANKYGSSASAR